VLWVKYSCHGLNQRHQQCQRNQAGYAGTLLLLLSALGGFAHLPWLQSGEVCVRVALACTALGASCLSFACCTTQLLAFLVHAIYKSTNNDVRPPILHFIRSSGVIDTATLLLGSEPKQGCGMETTSVGNFHPSGALVVEGKWVLHRAVADNRWLWLHSWLFTLLLSLILKHDFKLDSSNLTNQKFVLHFLLNLFHTNSLKSSF
jgi:hypothetical protein